MPPQRFQKAAQTKARLHREYYLASNYEALLAASKRRQEAFSRELAETIAGRDVVEVERFPIPYGLLSLIGFVWACMLLAAL